MFSRVAGDCSQRRKENDANSWTVEKGHEPKRTGGKEKDGFSPGASRKNAVLTPWF